MRPASCFGGVSMAKEFDPKSWAHEQRILSSRKCLGCQEPYRSVTQNVLDEMVSGRAPGVSLEALTKMLVDKYGFTNGVSALRQHIRRHEPERWQQIRSS